MHKLYKVHTGGRDRHPDPGRVCAPGSGSSVYLSSNRSWGTARPVGGYRMSPTWTVGWFRGSMADPAFALSYGTHSVPRISQPKRQCGGRGVANGAKKTLLFSAPSAMRHAPTS